MVSDCFPPDYFSARERFRAAARAQGLLLEAWPIGQRGPGGEELTIDVALLARARQRRSVVLSSGLHGAEGPLGSAVQLALLEQPQHVLAGLGPDVGLVLIHALNPYGYAWRRRWNEDGVDLNRNFLLAGQAFAGAPPLYGALDAFINPRTPPSRWEPYLPGLVKVLIQHGFNVLKHNVPIGQYEYPQGLFFGGKGPSAAQRILREHLARWLGASAEITHIDIHTGLGPWARYSLIVEGRTAVEGAARLMQRFGAEAIQIDSFEGSNFQERGGLGPWCEALLPERRYDFITAEFGTYPSLLILEVLRDENRAHCWAQAGQRYEWAKARLMQRFAPASPSWRRRCLEQGLAVCRRACAELHG